MPHLNSSQERENKQTNRTLNNRNRWRKAVTSSNLPSLSWVEIGDTLPTFTGSLSKKEATWLHRPWSELVCHCPLLSLKSKFHRKELYSLAGRQCSRLWQEEFWEQLLPHKHSTAWNNSAFLWFRERWGDGRKKEGEREGGREGEAGDGREKWNEQ